MERLSRTLRKYYLIFFKEPPRDSRIANHLYLPTWTRRVLRKQGSRLHVEPNPRSRYGIINHTSNYQPDQPEFLLISLKQLDYVACQMTAGSDRTHQTCVEAFGVPWNEILQCVESEFATRQQLEYEQITRESLFVWPKPVHALIHKTLFFFAVPVLEAFNWVPTIAYNGKITELSHSGRAPPLKEIICEMIHNTNPACALTRRF